MDYPSPIITDNRLCYERRHVNVVNRVTSEVCNYIHMW